jgi:hypothetical protein
MYSFGPKSCLSRVLTFDYPDSYGYRLIFKNLEDYVNGMSLTSWHQWISYETEYLKKDMIIKSTIDSIEHSVDIMEKYGIWDRSRAQAMRFYLQKDKMTDKIISDKPVPG